MLKFNFYNLLKEIMLPNKEKEASLTQVRLKELLTYDKETGLFYWLVSKGSVKAGQLAGRLVLGYVMIGIDGYHHRAHRLAWLYIYGTFPNKENKPFIDHINRNKADNRIENLRESSKAENKRNTGLYNGSQSGFKGIEILPSGNFRARIQNPFTKKVESLGTHATAEEAQQIYENKARLYHSDFYAKLTEIVKHVKN